MLLPSRKASIGSTYNSGEDIATYASSEAGERQSMGMLASPLFTQKREASATPSRIYQPKLRRCTRTKESRAEIQKGYRSLFPREEGFSPATEKVRIFLNYEQIKPPKESRQLLPKLSEAEYHTRLVLEEQKGLNIVCSTRSEIYIYIYIYMQI